MNFKSYFNKNHLFLNLLIFLFIIFVFTNYMHNTFEKHEEEKNLSFSTTLDGEKIYKLKKDSLKLDISKNLVFNEQYDFIIKRECKITGQMSDRHKVRWIRNIIHKEFLGSMYKINQIAPYYVEIIIHSLFIFLSLLLLRKFFSIEDKYTVLFLLLFTYIFQQHMGEYSYSVLDLFFITSALCASKAKNILFFILLCTLAVLNRETGFITLLCWFIFNNNDFKKFFLASFFTTCVFLLANYQIIACLFQPKFFAPMEYQYGQINYSDLFKSNIFSIIKILLNNYIIPFGIGFYLFFNSKVKNNYLFLIFIVYLIIFLIATPVHKIELKLLLLPYLWLFVFFFNKKNV